MMSSNSLNDLNRKIHIHLGLFLLLFIWIFSLTGLILNHGGWKFTSFWEERVEKKTEFSVPKDLLIHPDAEIKVMEYLRYSGEVQIQERTSDVLDFRIQSPGIVRDLHIDLMNGTGTEKLLKFNIWGKLRTLHTFNGMNRENPSESPNWWITNIWRVAMDGIAIGLIVICVSSWIMWYKIRKEYKIGYLILLSGFLVAGYFAV